MNTKIVRLSAFNYFGGKTRHLDWILPKLDRRHRARMKKLGKASPVFDGGDLPLFEDGGEPTSNVAN